MQIGQHYFAVRFFCNKKKHLTKEKSFAKLQKMSVFHYFFMIFFVDLW